MNRIHNSNKTWTHPEANRWLTKFMVRYKKMVLIEENYQPFTIEYLNEWNIHAADYSQCLDFQSPINKWTNEPPLEHQNALIFFHELIADLKVYVQGVDVVRDNIFDEHRIEEADKHYANLHDCKKRQIIHY